LRRETRCGRPEAGQSILMQGHVRPEFAAPWEALHDLPPCRI
jgi:hypothetical protein